MQHSLHQHVEVCTIFFDSDKNLLGNLNRFHSDLAHFGIMQMIGMQIKTLYG